MAERLGFDTFMAPAATVDDVRELGQAGRRLGELTG